MTIEEFEKEVASGTTLVDFWSPSCGPCKLMLTVVDQVHAELGDAVKILKLDVNENMDLARKHGVRMIPSFFVYRNGSIVNQFENVKDKAFVLNALK